MFSENVGKLVVTKNPFSINYVSWVSTVKYGFKTLKWIAYDREILKVEYAQEFINNNWEYLIISANDLNKKIPVYYID